MQNNVKTLKQIKTTTNREHTKKALQLAAALSAHTHTHTHTSHCIEFAVNLHNNFVFKDYLRCAMLFFADCLHLARGFISGFEYLQFEIMEVVKINPALCSVIHTARNCLPTSKTVLELLAINMIWCETAAATGSVRYQVVCQCFSFWYQWQCGF